MRAQPAAVPCLLSGALLLTACGGGSSADGSKSPKSAGAVSLDNCGRKITIASAPKATIPAGGVHGKVAAEVRERIADEVRRPGFLAVTARIGSRLCGFGTAVRSADPAPEHPVLGARRSQEWLAGAVRITDLVVAPAARGRGVGTGILDVLCCPPWTTGPGR
ncbi:hypothetical protein [Streptomyces mirabilis]|uniref:hypothetical protein n=1 Tax=Streptomyces mirabilis TaxID=68239 RepID=UPI0033B73315